MVTQTTNRTILAEQLCYIDKLRQKYEADGVLTPLELSHIANEAQVYARLAELGFTSAAPRLEVLFADAIDAAPTFKAVANLKKTLKGLLGAIHSGKHTEQDCLSLAETLLANKRHAR